ncbi:hypothetical protein WA026_022995 [Henosepilachna vigintioctopunctata]|uniref:Uncharacterized protein n=1 Tax=Henosepilachna vigintioctopunctata TaxID=420089 RepID=A0AAW1UT87_9CUCU
MEGQIVRGHANEPIAMKRALGWILSGSVSTLRDNNSPCVSLLTHEETLDAMFHKFFAQEEFATDAEYLSSYDTENE